MSDPFSAKLSLVIRSLSVSRARLAAELAVNKSVVARWLSGATTPSEHNLARLSALVAGHVPGFTVLDWDRDLAALAALMGVKADVGPRPQSGASPFGVELHFSEEIRAATRWRGRSYEGIYRSTRPYAGLPGRFIHDHCLVRMRPDGFLGLRMATSGVRVEGWVLPLNNQVYVIGSEFTSGAMVFALLNGSSANKVVILDGLILAPSLDTIRTPTANAILLERVSDLSPDPAADDALIDQLGATEAIAPEGSVPEAVRSHLARNDSESLIARANGLLRLPVSQSLTR
jgi:hypothetical protein